MNCDETIEFYIRDARYHMEMSYIQATGKPLDWDKIRRDDYMSKMRMLQGLANEFLDNESQLQMFLEMKGRISVKL